MSQDNESARCTQHGLTYDPATGCVLCNAQQPTAIPASAHSGPGSAGSDLSVRDINPISPVTGLLLYFLTCSLYEYFVWMPHRIRAVNALMGRHEFNVWNVMLLSILTCGVMYIYYEYQMGVAINEVKKARGLNTSDSLPLVTVLFDLFQLGFMSSFMHQEELNKMLA